MSSDPGVKLNSMFLESESYNVSGLVFDSRVRKALQPIFDYCVENDYKVHDLVIIINNAVGMMSTFAMSEREIKKRIAKSG